MEFFAFIGAITVIEWLLYSAFILMMLSGAVRDRSDDAEGLKWLGVLGIAGVAVSNLGISGTLTAVSSMVFWKIALVYLIAGLVYSAVEFTFHTRRVAKAAQEELATCTKENMLYDSTAMASSSVIKVKFNVGPAGQETRVTPSIDRSGLVSAVSAWTLLWPAFAVTLVANDMLTSVVEYVVDLTSNLADRTVKAIFRSVGV